MANVKLTKQSSEGEIKAYFTAVLELVKRNEDFPVNLDDVWPLVFSRKDAALRALVDDELFMQDVDYQVFHQNVENLKEEKPKGGRPTDTYMLSVPCMEFFIARRVRPVFEVYRQIFHKTMSEAEAKVGQTKSWAEELAEMGTYYRQLSLYSTIDEWGEPIISARAYYEHVYTGDLRGRDFEEWFAQRARSLSFRLNDSYNVMKRPTEWEPKPKGQDFALCLLALLKLADYDRDLYKGTDPERSRRAGGIGQVYSDCCVKLDYEEEHYTVSQFVVDMRELIYGVRALKLRVPHMERIVDGSDGFAPDRDPLTPTALAAYHDELHRAAAAGTQAWAVYEVTDGDRKPQCVDLASPELTTREVCQAMKRFDDEMTKRFDAAADRERTKDGKGEIAAVRDDYRTAFYSLRRSLCNLVFIEQAVSCDNPDTEEEEGKEAAV